MARRHRRFDKQFKLDVLRKIEESDRPVTSIARDLGTSYTISYTPIKPPGDNKLRRIEIRPIDTRLHLIQSRTGYYAK